MTPDPPAVAAAKAINEYVFNGFSGPLVEMQDTTFDHMASVADAHISEIIANVAAIISKHYAPKLEAAEKMEKALEGYRQALTFAAFPQSMDGREFEVQLHVAENHAAAALAAWKASQ